MQCPDATTTWTSGGCYLSNKSKLAYGIHATDDAAVSLLSQPTSPPDVTIGNIVPNVFRSKSDYESAYAAGPEWLYTNTCAKEVIDNTGTDHAWGTVEATNRTTACTDSTLFPAVSQGALVADVVFEFLDPACACTVSYFITATSFPSTTPDVTYSDSYVPLSPVQNGKFIVGSFGSNPIQPKNGLMSYYTKDKLVGCVDMPFMVGSDKQSVQPTAGVSMKLCHINGQRTACVTTPCTLANSECAAYWYGATCEQVNYTVADTMPTTNVSEQALVFRQTDTFFTALTGTDNKLCEQDTTRTACAVLNGVVRPLANQAESLYTHEPNNFRDHTRCNGHWHSCYVGAVYAVPVVYSLLNPSPVAPVDQNVTYLAKLLDCRGVLTADACCSTAAESDGWAYLTSMISDLCNALPVNQDTHYDNFVQAYFGYAAVQLYFLSNVCGYTANISTRGRSRYGFFLDAGAWSESARQFAQLQTTCGNITNMISDVFSVDASRMLADSRPVLEKYDGVAKTIRVTLTVPAVLLSTIMNITTAAFDPIKVSNLLLQMFPLTVVGPGGAQPTAVFDAASNLDGTAASTAVAKGLTMSGQSSFIVSAVDKPAEAVAFFLATTGIPSACTFEPSDKNVAATPLLAVRFGCTVAVGSSEKPVTLMFYLAYLSANASSPVPGMSEKCFIDTALTAQSFAPLPFVMDWSAACAALANTTCARDGVRALQYVGNDAEWVNSLFLGPAAPACKCLEGSNLPPLEQQQSGQMNEAAMCFNLACRDPSVNLDSILTNANVIVDGKCPDCSGSGTPAPGCSAQPYDCKPLCDEYRRVLQNNNTTTQSMELTDVDWDTLQTTCGLDVLSMFPQQQSTRLQYFAGIGLFAAAMPVLYAVAALCQWRRGKPFKQTLAGRPAFIWVCIAVWVVTIAAVVFLLTDFRGKQVCVGGGARLPTVADAFAYPVSSCQVQSKLLALLGAGRALTVPQELCSGTPQSYCEYFPDPINPTNDLMDKPSCASTSTQACQQHGDDGLCIAEAGRPYLGRPLKISSVAQDWSLSTLVLCIGLAAASVPAVTVASWHGLHDTISKGACIAVTILIAVFVLCACFVYMLVKYFNKVTAYAIGYGRCASLNGYPDTLVSMSPLTGGALVYVVSDGPAFNGAPVYVANNSSGDDGYARSARSAPLVGHFSASSYGAYCYAGTNGMFVLTDTPPYGSTPVVVVYQNNTSTPALMDKPAKGASPMLHSGFQQPNGGALLTFCGKIGRDSSCGNVYATCPCAPAADTHSSGVK